MDNSTFLNQFDSIPVSDLPRIAEMNARLADIIEHHYIRGVLHLHEKPVFFQLRDEEPPILGYANTTQYNPDPSPHNMIDLWQSNKALSAFKQFCHIFTYITFTVLGFGNTRSQEFFKYVGNHCKNATKRFVIHSVNSEALANWKYSFDDKTTQIKIYGKLNEYVPLKDLFPNMQHFIKHLTEPFVRHYPRLTNSSVFSIIADDDINPNVHEFIRLNPQLRSSTQE